MLYEKGYKSQDPHIQAIFEFKNKVEEIRDKIKKGDITELDDIKHSITPLVENINAKLQQKPSRIMQSKMIISLDTPTTQIEPPPPINKNRFK